MRTLSACPSCGSASLQPFAFTVEAERHHDVHVAQSRCRTCDLVFSNPVAAERELARFYASSYYEEHEPEYDASQPGTEALVRARGEAEARGLRQTVLPFVSGGVFFEIGGGFGGLLDGARRLGFEVMGVEPSEQAARFAREVMGLSGVRHGLLDARDWPTAFCDVIYSYMVIEHVADLHAFVGDIYTMLKPGGLTVIGTENHHNAWVAMRRLRSWLRGRRLPEFQTANHHTFYFSDASLRALLERHGFEIVQCRVYTPSLEEKLPHYDFRHWYSRLAFYLLHYADAWTGRGGRLLVWARKGGGK